MEPALKGGRSRKAVVVAGLYGVSHEFGITGTFAWDGDAVGLAAAVDEVAPLPGLEDGDEIAIGALAGDGCRAERYHNGTTDASRSRPGL